MHGYVPRDPIMHDRVQTRDHRNAALALGIKLSMTRKVDATTPASEIGWVFRVDNTLSALGKMLYSAISYNSRSRGI